MEGTPTPFMKAAGKPPSTVSLSAIGNKRGNRSPGPSFGKRRGNSRQPFLRFRSDAWYNCQAFHKLCHST